MKSFLKQLCHCLLLPAVIFFSSCQKESVFKSYAKPEVIIAIGDARLSRDTIHLVKDTVYILAASISRNRGQKLIVDAGTLVKVNDGIGITINQGARIEAAGTATEPIVFTSSAAKGAPGNIGENNQNEHSWLGIAISGNYPQLIDSSVTGTGVLKYVRIEFAGRSSNLSNFQQLPSLLLQNVGRGTIVENIEASYSANQHSFKIYGGNVDASNLVSYACGGSDFVLGEGYSGRMQNLLAYRHPYFSPRAGSNTTLAGLILAGENTFTIVSNLTVLGPDLQNGTNLKYFDTTRAGSFGNVDGSKVAAVVVEAGRFRIRNSVLLGFPRSAVYINAKLTARSLEDGSSDFRYCVYHSNDTTHTFYLTPNIYKQYTSQDLKDLLLRSDYAGQQFLSSSQFNFADPFGYDYNPNPSPSSSSPLLSGANFDDPYFDNAFIKKVTYRGAIGADNWLQGWTNFIPLQTNYNN
ncbi:hypothetical protein QWZ08_14135 [Ferruginibacter paludis]|uniref:hypothetical protein n=1 Tax=Ferruginibacter paludis TaxID=1310417 RepID=UPI0025B4BF96|nr:hypothetical protein [Ferruginibacter paludis]MDN3656781.1 hypothetical protein [Ferruginibacter paludis]